MKKTAAILVFLGIILASAQFVAGAIPAGEREALIALYNSTGGDSWTDCSGWKTPPLDVDGFAMPGTEGGWFGVTVTSDQVTQIILTSNNLVGSIPVEIGNLAGLVNLALSSNQISGTIPSGLGSLAALQEISLCDNQLTGGIPFELGSLTNLKTLNLWVNQLSGTIPNELGNLNNLEVLYLQSNQLTGSIPAELGSLSALTNLDLSNNQLTGSIPSQLGSLANLVFLDLGSNQLSGSIPTELFSLSNLQFLKFGTNQLSGAIPSEIGNLTSLKQIHVNYNQFTGSIPNTIGNLVGLEELYLNSNQFSGSIPTEIGSLINLIRLSLRDNQLTGGIPGELGGLSNLLILDLMNNQLSGSIPADLSGLTSLQSLDLQSNQLSGSIPSGLGGLTALSYLNLRDNQLSGAIPSEIGNMSSLVELGLDANQFSGSIPAEIGNLAQLTSLNLGGNLLSGSIPPEIGNLTSLTYFGLDGNQLSGSIPAQIGNLGNLTELWLNNNRLTGSIPAGLGSLTALNGLNLSGNMLSGAAPSSLASLIHLNENSRYTDLGYNAVYSYDPALISFLDDKDPDWASSQTVAPQNVQAATMSGTSVMVSWVPITFSGGPGGYRVFYSVTPGGPYSFYAQTENKSATSQLVSGLVLGGIYYFVVQARTEPNSNNQNTVDSENSNQASATAAGQLAVSGTVTLNGAPLAGVAMNGLPGNPVTDADGNYGVMVEPWWSGTVTPALAGFSFSPASRSYVNIAADQPGQNYAAGEAATEPNDDPASAYTLPMGTTEGLVFVQGDLDCYKFFVPEEAAGQDLKINVHVTSPYPDPIPSGWRSDMDFELLDAAQRVLGIAISAGDNETLYLHDVAPGWYYVCVTYSETEYADSSGFARYAIALETGTGFGLGFVSGRVVDGGGAGIQDVFLFLDPVTTDWGPPRPYMTTGPGGYFTIAYTPGTYTLQFTGGGAAGGISLFHTPVNVVAEYYNDVKKYADAAQLTFAAGQTLALEDAVLETGATVTGHVTDLSGNPLANVWVRWYDLEMNTVSNERCMTDADGNYSFGGGPVGGAKLRFNKSGYATEYFDNQPTFGTAAVLPTVSGGTLSGYDAQLGAGGTLFGTVTDGAANPIPGIRVRIYSTLDETFNYANGLTDSNGGFGFRVLPGDYKVFFDTTGLAYTPEWYDNTGSFAAATVVSVGEGGSVSGIDAQLDAKPAISGHIDLAGYPLAGVALNGLPGATAPLTGADGNYSALVDYNWSGTVTPTLAGFAFIPSERVYANLTSDQAGQNFTAVEANTEPNNGSASASELPMGVTAGLIFVAGDPDFYKFFVPVESAGQDLRVNVRVTSPYPDPIPYPEWASDLDFQLFDGSMRLLGMVTSRSDNETLYLHNVASGWYYLYVGFSTTEYADTNAFARYTVTLEAGTGFGLGTINGRVVNGSGAGVEGVLLYLDPVPYDWNVSHAYMTTGADGYFTIAFTPGTFTLKFTNGDTRTEYFQPPNVVWEYYDNKKKLADAEPIILSSGQAVDLGEIQLETGAIITGRVTDSSGTPLLNAFAWPYDLEGNGGEVAMTDANGDYTVNGVQPGGVKLRFSRTNYANEFYDDKPSLGSGYTLPTVAGGTIVGVNAQLGAGGRITGTVSDEMAAGIANVKVCLYSVLDPAFSRVSVMTGSGGGYSIPRVMPGDYKVYFDSSGLGYAPEWHSDAAAFAGATVVTVTEGNTTSEVNGILAPAGIMVTSPIAGDRWLIGSVHAIAWDGRGAVGTVRIEYSPDNGASWIEIAAATANDGGFDWTLPPAASTACLVRVSESDGDPSGTSGVFSIEPWLPNEGMQYNMVVHGTAYNGDGLAASGDWIGAFGPGGAGDCRATARIGAGGSFYLTVRGDESSPQDILFKLWPLASGTGIDSLERVGFVPDKVYGGLPLHFGARTQSLALVNGWNWVSWNILPDDTSLGSVFAPILGAVQQVKTQTQAAVYSGGSWIGDLADMSGIGSGVMYKIKTGAACNLSFSAPGILFNLPIAMVTGWNWVAYLPTESQPAAEAVGSIFDAITQVKSQTQSAIKIGGELTGDLAEMRPDLGYTVKVTAPGFLSYPYGPGAGGSESYGAPPQKAGAAGAPNWLAITGNQYNMVAYGKVSIDGVPVTGEGYFVGTFGPRGAADCRSISAVGREGDYFATIRGDRIGETLRFVLYDSNRGKSYDASESAPFVIDGLRTEFDLHFASAASCAISGAVTCAGVPLAGVTLSGLPGDPQTDAAGLYSAAVSIGWSGTVTPFKPGYAFIPASTTYENIAASQSTSYAASALSSLSVTSPNGRESWAPGSVHAITWTQNELAGDVTIELYKNGTRHAALGMAAAAAGTFSWAIPASQALGDGYKIRVSQGTIEDFSDGTFAIALAPSDFNRDGLSDILWRYYGMGGMNQVWLIGTAGMAVQPGPGTDAAESEPEPEPENCDPQESETMSDEEMMGDNAAMAADPHQALALPAGDLNAALAWGSAAAGRPGLSLLQTVHLASRTDTAWEITGTGDFNHDGKADIIWRHARLGKNQIWLMDGKARLASVNLPGLANRQWRIVGSGDFNGDGETDIVWRFYGNGGYDSVWLMKGAKVKAVAQLPAMADTRWEAVGCGDFNGDRHADIVWRYNGAGGANAVWLMDGTKLSEQQALPSESDLRWNIGGVGDCNGDGKSDLIWRYYGESGADIIWLMDGLALLSQEMLPAKADRKWKIENH